KNLPYNGSKERTLTEVNQQKHLRVTWGAFLFVTTYETQKPSIFGSGAFPTLQGQEEFRILASFVVSKQCERINNKL
ncbi:MAG: hypothetical protein P8X54_08930, partial [Desulfuromonadales bacterium]